ncbi:hypothetical protein [Ruminococcus sp.]|uniref:hypothetical protein n=1 Tax=Ruminococcus sp. TaxID=41978 RepID=UPI0025E1E427|nr:hypothetical protein [Ruminococcus sp.]MBQ6252493.1 hypothetical protein [Ruminococcus sp.]
MKKIIGIIIILNLFVLIMALLTKCRENIIYKTEVEDIHSGTIVDKKIVNPEHGIFKSHGTEYYIVIDTEISKPGVLLHTNENLTKSFSVSKETYLQYKIGENFDSYTIEKPTECTTEKSTNKTTIINGTEYELVPRE